MFVQRADTLNLQMKWMCHGVGPERETAGGLKPDPMLVLGSNRRHTANTHGGVALRNLRHNGGGRRDLGARVLEDLGGLREYLG